MLRIGVKTSMWNPWHGCHKFSTGCQHCYVYRTDGKYGKDSSVVTKTEKFNLPIQQRKTKLIRYLPVIWSILVLLLIFWWKMLMHGVLKHGR